MHFAPMAQRLHTERLVLSPEHQGDAGWFTELLNERGTGTFTLDDAHQRIAAMNDLTARLGIGVLVLRRRSDGEALGYSGIVVGRGSVAEPELAYELLPHAHGRGYATEASRAVLEAGFATGRERIWATMRRWNTPSFRVVEKLGFHRDHTTTDNGGELVWLVRER